ncbi:hypothetical protein [Actinomadura madurae]|uniref:hypothetical protein n=1 Tax=Actinomadura madurae TaxID=1993 RepID=UPI0009449550|nr:hypothetical protein [Actinomadura madurae]
MALLAQVVAVTAMPDYFTRLLYAALLGAIVAIESPELHQAMDRLRAHRADATPHRRAEPVSAVGGGRR